jgi:hypothetical protein
VKNTALAKAANMQQRHPPYINVSHTWMMMMTTTTMMMTMMMMMPLDCHFKYHYLPHLLQRAQHLSQGSQGQAH